MRFFLFITALFCTQCIQAKAPKIFPFAKDGKWGVINEHRQVLLKPSFEHIGRFSSYYIKADQSTRNYAVAKVNGKFGLIDEMGQWHIEAKFDSITDELHRPIGFRLTQKDGVWGFITGGTAKVSEVVTPRYKRIFGYRNDCPWAVFQEDSKYGAIDILTGNIILKNLYSSVEIGYYFALPDGNLSSEKGFFATKGKERFFFDKTGAPYTGEIWEYFGITEEPPEPEPFQSSKVLYPCTISQVEDNWQVEIFKRGKSSPIATETLSGFDTVQEVVLQYEKKGAAPSIKFIIGTRNGRYGVADKKGNTMIPFDYAAIQIEQEAWTVLRWRVRKDGMWGLYNKQLQQTLPCAFTHIGKKKRWYAPVKTATGYEGYSDLEHVYLPKSLDLSIPKRTIPYPHSDSEKVHYSGAQNPKFPGGKEAMEAFLVKNTTLALTTLGKKAGTQLYFTVEKDGSMTNPKIAGRNVDPEIEEELLRLFELLPPYSIAVKEGYAVRGCGRFTVWKKE